MTKIDATTITVNGIDYVPASSISAPVTGDRAIMVLDRGWIFVGNVADNEDGTVSMTCVKNLRKWGSGGFGLASRDPKAAGVVLDSSADMTFDRKCVIFRVPVSAQWGDGC